jgi:hypothetical protein
MGFYVVNDSKIKSHIEKKEKTNAQTGKNETVVVETPVIEKEKADATENK